MAAATVAIIGGPSSATMSRQGCTAGARLLRCMSTASRKCGGYQPATSRSSAFLVQCARSLMYSETIRSSPLTLAHAQLSTPFRGASLLLSGSQSYSSQHRRCSRAISASAESTAAEATETKKEEKLEPGEIGALDIRVGRVLKAWKHPEADGLFVEEVEVGEEAPRTIVSGLVGFVPLEAMQNRLVVVLCNLKARNMRGIKSFGMLMAASDAAHENVELLTPPEGAQPGERISFGTDPMPEPWKENKLQKQKMWERTQPELNTSEDRVARHKDTPFMTSAGPVTVNSLTGASIS